jgi:hypothetical protein
MSYTCVCNITTMTNDCYCGCVFLTLTRCSSFSLHIHLYMISNYCNCFQSSIPSILSMYYLKSNDASASFIFTISLVARLWVGHETASLFVYRNSQKSVSISLVKESRLYVGLIPSVHAVIKSSNEVNPEKRSRISVDFFASFFMIFPYFRRFRRRYEDQNLLRYCIEELLLNFTP